jgi:transcription antitermination factor NusA-like protein
MATINMQTMRYLNLLAQITRVRARKCFVYNNVIYFAVHPKLFSKALGPEGKNLRIISERLGKRVRIIRDVLPNVKGVEKFIESIVSPAEFVSVEIKDNFYVITAGSRTRAATLIGRNKIRLEQLSKIINSYFGKEVKVV